MRTHKAPSKKRASKESELARAAKSASQPAITNPPDADERLLLAEALRRAEEARDTIEDALVGFGRWVFVQVFNDDAAAALGDRRDNPVWCEMLARAGGPTLRLSERMPHVALHIAAYDKCITDQTWRQLEAGRKEILLPLADVDALRKAAQHVTAMKLTQRATRAYVRTLLAERGAEGTARVTASMFGARVRRFREGVADKGFQRRAIAVLNAGEAEEVESVRRELEALRAWAGGMLAKIRGR